MYKLELTRQQLEDVLSALSFWKDSYETTRGPAPETCEAMEKLSEKFWKIIKKTN